MSAPQHPRRTGHWLIPVVGLILVCSVVGGFAARQFYAVGATAPGGHSTTNTAEPSDTGAPAVDPKSRTVVMTRDAQSSPVHDQVRRTAQRFFDSINDRDYQNWLKTVSYRLGQSKPEAAWKFDYDTTQDTAMVVERINPAHDGSDSVIAMVNFTSHQAVKKAPTKAPSDCNQWWIVWSMVWEQGNLVIDAGTANLFPQVRICQ
ncbi:hypothetical protein GCM10010174_55260 [Kutzneria viridogrisea]|uniref:Uncharacterized protein n=2 Tax=Kutzneria TaxID=43356 RepID=A0ABR6BKN7_9PSEU|nr:hypothetical protein [Kutzneria albida]AHH95209.1 putative secreted protein [Kutzneria albida DSM 43870]MBA8927434.1 hypothetical protein [Kutzneria viridogrisea]